MYKFKFQSRQQSHIKAQQRIKQQKLIAKAIVSIRNKKIQRAKMIHYYNTVQLYNKAHALQEPKEPPTAEEEPAIE